MTLGEELLQVMRDMDAAFFAWVDAGQPMNGTAYDEREAVYARLRDLTARMNHPAT